MSDAEMAILPSNSPNAARNVVGIDASESMLRAAKQKAEREEVDVEFRIAAAQHLPGPPERFDIVVAVTVLCFVEDAAPVFREMARVLRPGGRLVVGELGKWSIWAAVRRVRGWLGSPLWRKGKFWTAGELRALADQGGLETESVCGAIYYPCWGLAARLLAPFDRSFSRVTTYGAAFLALHAIKPVRAD